MPSRIPISDLEEINSVTGNHYIPVDDGTATNKITVDNYNASANTTAQAYATAAGNSATAAANSASSASSTASEINNKLNQASTLVSNASTYASNASASASAASNSATAAAGSATSAENSATSAAGSVTAADNKAKLAQSWAVGTPSGMRADEATNNAKYWASVAMGAAGGGVSTFNGRTGAVISSNEDYSASMIQAGVDEHDNPIYVSDKLTELNTECGTNADAITAVSGRVTTLEGRVTVLTATLTAGQTTLTFTSNKIGADSLITVMASVDGVEQPRKSVSGTTLTLTFEAMQSDVSIKVKIENY